MSNDKVSAARQEVARAPKKCKRVFVYVMPPSHFEIPQVRDAHGDVCLVNYHKSDDETEANARLIAAAPKLWDALIDSELRVQELREALPRAIEMVAFLRSVVLCGESLSAEDEREIDSFFGRAEALLSEEKKLHGSQP
jgi:hypothetical protein